jgi:hypothetical protein
MKKNKSNFTTDHHKSSSNPITTIAAVNTSVGDVNGKKNRGYTPVAPSSAEDPSGLSK